MAGRLGFAPYDFVDYAPTPAPQFNGGQYTGDACRAGAGWCAVPVKPEAGSMNTVTLASARPPPGAMQQPASNLRQGNNLYEPPGYGLEYGFIRCPVAAPQQQQAPRPSRG